MSTDLEILDSIVLSRSRGASREPLAFGEPRPLGAEDLPLVLSPPKNLPATPSASITRIRQHHHTIARMLAEGAKDLDIAAAVGITSSRISVLKADPSFQDLVAYYKEQKEQVFIDIQTRLRDLGLATVEELMERLEETGDKFSNGELMKLAQMCAEYSLVPGAAAHRGGGASAEITLKFVQPGQGEASPLLDIIPHPAVGTRASGA